MTNESVAAHMREIIRTIDAGEASTLRVCRALCMAVIVLAENSKREKENRAQTTSFDPEIFPWLNHFGDRP